MTFLRKAAVVVAAAAMTIGLAGVSSPATATDTGWDFRAKQGPGNVASDGRTRLSRHYNCTHA